MNYCNISIIFNQININGFVVRKHSKEELRAYKKLLSETLGEINKQLKSSLIAFGHKVIIN